jgi:isocitrate dehydrogenase
MYFMQDIVSIAVAYGDGIGPEIMEATLAILREAKARIRIETIDIGKKMYERGFSTGIPDEAWQTIHSCKTILKAPITTPQGGGYKSLNVTLRKSLNLYSNVRPCRAYTPFVESKHPEMDLVIVRENEEDLYAGVEYRQTHNSYNSIKMITRMGCEKIIRYAFEYAVNNSRKKITCMSKDNIMKFSDGIFHKVFDEIAKEYPHIENEHYIIDIGAARLASRPGIFDVVVTSNLYGDIISDITAETSGSVGLAGSANIGNEYAMFEAIHGSAPDIAGKNIANPSGLINAAIMMLVHIGQGDIANTIYNAWATTIEEGIHTADIYNEKISKTKVGTKEFAEAIIARMNKLPKTLLAANYPAQTKKHAQKIEYIIKKAEKKQLVGVDVFINWSEGNQEQLADIINKIAQGTELGLKTIANRGLKVWPRNSGDTLITENDLWQLRLVPSNAHKTIKHTDIIIILKKLAEELIDFVKIENLYIFDDNLGFSLIQGD